MHNEKVEERKSQHIKCPICFEERKEILANHDSLIQHLVGADGRVVEGRATLSRHHREVSRVQIPGRMASHGCCVL
jgi:hypothetical protein